MAVTDTLRAAGVPDRQAVAHARATDEAVGDGVGDLVTNDQLRAELATLTWRLLGGIGALLALFRLLDYVLPPAA